MHANPSLAGNYDTTKKSGPQIDITNLEVAFSTKAGSLTVLENISLSIQTGELLSIVGPSGCGKTTLLNCIAGLLTPRDGQVRFDGAPLNLGDSAIAMCFQEPGLLPWRAVMGNILLGIESRRGLPRGEARDRARAAARDVGLERFLDHYPKQLSGGMKMRVVLARAIAMQAPVLLMDEPFAALDSFTRESMQELVLDLYVQHRFTGVLITHSIEEALYMGDRVVVMAAQPSRILADLPVEEPYPRPYAARTSPAVTRLRAQVHEMLMQTQTDGDPESEPMRMPIAKDRHD